MLLHYGGTIFTSLTVSFNPFFFSVKPHRLRMVLGGIQSNTKNKANYILFKLQP